MATAEILASGTTALRSSKITLATGESRTLIMRAAGQGVLAIQVQASDASWVTIGGLDAQYPAKQIYGPGVYSVYRDATAIATAADAAS